MQLTISGTELKANESLELLIEWARESEISFVELWHPQNTSGLGLKCSKKLLKESGLKVACVGTGTELYRNGGSTDDQANLFEAIKVAKRLGASFVNTYFGHYELRDDRLAIETYLKFLSPCLDLAAESGVTIVLENEFNAFGRDYAASDITRRPYSLKKLFERVNRQEFRLNFDPSNFYCAGVEPFPYAYYLLRRFIAYCHIKDVCLQPSCENSVTRSTNWRKFSDFDQLYVTCAMGDGAIPWNNILRALDNDGYNGFLTLEPHSEEGIRLQAFKQSADFIRQNWKLSYFKSSEFWFKQGGKGYGGK